MTMVAQRSTGVKVNTKHAVLTRSSLIVSNVTDAGPKLQRIAFDVPVTTVTGIYEIAMQAKVTHVWVMPDVVIGMQVDNNQWDVFATWGDDGDTSPVFARIYKKGTYGEVKVGFPDNGKWGWAGTNDPVTVLATIYYLETVLGIPVDWSPGHMGTELVYHLNRTEKRQEWIREPSMNLHGLPFKKAARDILWKYKQPLLGNMFGMYLHQLDKRSSYLSVCPGLYVGTGDPIHVTCVIDTSLPGIYHVSTTDVPSDTDTLPPIISTEWVTSDVLTYALELGYEITVYEAWQWTEKHKTLESYARKLWEARNVFRTDTDRFPHKQGRENAHATMKEIALVATGKFGSDKKTSHLKRPDWWASVVGKARVNMFRAIYKTFHKTGLTPILIYSDSVYYLSNDPNPLTAIAGMTDRQDELGGFRHEGTWLVTPDLIEAFNTAKNAGTFQKWLERAPKIASEVHAA